MAILFEMLEAEALKLTKPERARLAEHLIASLDEDSEIEEAWAAEIEKRIEAIERCAVQLIPAADVLAYVKP